MRAAVMRKGRIEVGEVPEPSPGQGEVLVRTLACGICGSDLHVLQHTHRFAEASGGIGGNNIDPDRDLVMGHEFCAEVLDYGPGASRKFSPGTRVCSMPVLIRPPEAKSVGYSHEFPGGYGERMVLSEALLLPVPNGLSTEHAALTEPMAVGLHAVRMARLTPADVPLVIGCGPVGLAVIAALKLSGAAPVVAADFSPARRKLAEQVGADIVIDPGQHSPYASWADAARASAQGLTAPVNPLTGVRTLPPGVFFECVGVPGVIDELMRAAPPQSRIIVAGVCMENDSIRPIFGINKELNVHFVLGYTPDEFARTLRALAEGEVDVAPMVTGTTGVEGVGDAFRTLANPEAHAKILVEPWRA